MKIKIIGAGISGLAAAYFLKEHDITIIEKSARPGGWIRTVEHDGFLFELGPRGVRYHQETFALFAALGLTPLPASKEARRRYVLHKDKLVPFSLPLLLKHGLLRDLLSKPSTSEDESIAAFFERHFSKSFVAHIIDPGVRGIFGGDPASLSIRSCFPTLWKRDQECGRLLHLPKKTGHAPLYSLQEGMESVVHALAKRFAITYNTPFDGEFDADHTIIACPYALSVPRLSLTTVSLGWHEKRLPKKGFGFLAPAHTEAPFLGMTWDSNVFPSQEGYTRLCVMMYEPNEEAALEAAERYLGLTNPDALLMHTAENAIPQYPLFHHKAVEQARCALPPNVHLIGNQTEGVAVNDCIACAKRLAEKIS